MKALLCLFFCSTVVFSISYAGKDSSVVSLEEIKFTELREKEIFAEISSTGNFFFDLFYLSGNYSYQEKDFQDFKNSFLSLKKELESSGILSKKTDKQIKAIYKSVHERFLRKYQLNTDFFQLSQSGEYNCVTATALYSLLLKELGIPFTIKETPEHVYLVAYPTSDAILIESTDPLKGYRAFNSDYKNLFLQNLKNNKIISESEYKVGNVDELFDKYFFPDENIGLKELVGIHYSNHALALLEKNLFADAFEQMKKACFLYPCEKNTFMLLQINLTLLANVDYKSGQQISDLVFISRFIGKGVEKDAFLGEFIRITYNYLTENFQPEKYDEIYKRLVTEIENQDIIDELNYIYNYERGRFFLTKGQIKNALPFSEKAFQLKPKNTDAQQNYVLALAQLFDNAITVPGLYETVDELPEQFPEISANNNFIRVQGYYHLREIETSFKNNNESKGLATMKKFEVLTSSYPDIKFDENFIGRAYSEAAVFYFKKGNDAKSLSVLKKGMQLAPNSQELKMRHSMIR